MASHGERSSQAIEVLLTGCTRIFVLLVLQHDVSAISNVAQDFGDAGIVHRFAFAALLALTWHAASTLLLLFSGVLFGIFLVAISDLLGRAIGGHHVLRLLLVCLFLTGLFSTVIVLGGATIAQQAQALSSTIRSQVATVKAFLEERGVDTGFLTFDASPARSRRGSASTPGASPWATAPTSP